MSATTPIPMHEVDPTTPQPLTSWLCDVAEFSDEFPAVALAEIWFEIEQWFEIGEWRDNWLVSATVNGMAICGGNSEVH